MDEKVLYRETIAIAGNDFEHGGAAATKVKAIMKEFGLDAGCDPPAVDREFRGRDERDHVRGRGELEFTVTAEAVRVVVADRGRGSPTSASRCRKGTRPPPPRCGRAGSAPAWACRTSSGQRDWFEIESTAGVGTTLRYGVRLGPAPGAGATNCRD